MGSIASPPGKLTVLIVEDEILIAMDLSDLLENGGYEVLGPVATVTAALDFLMARLPHACVLDVNLRGEHSAPVAARLKECGVPFLLSSAYGSDTLGQYEEFAGVTNVGKPAPTRLAMLIGALLDEAGQQNP